MHRDARAESGIPTAPREAAGALPKRRVVLTGLVAVLAAFLLNLSGVTSTLEQQTLNARFGLRGAQRPQDVVIVGVDESTVTDSSIPPWPFPRSMHARLVDRLHADGAKEIVYDVEFSHPTAPAQDLALYGSLARAGGAVLATSASDGHGHTDVLGGDANLAAIHAQAGAANVYNDSAGTITKLPYATGGLKSLAVVAAQRLGVKLSGSAQFPGGQGWIDYRGGPGTIETIPFSRVYHGEVAPSTFRGKIVVIGAIAPVLGDIHSTPVDGGRLMAGPEIQANAIWSALHGMPLRSAPGWLALLMLGLLALAAPMARLVLSVTRVVVLAVVLGALYALASQLAFSSGLVVVVVAPLLGLMIATAATVLVSYLGETRVRRRILLENERLEARVQERTRELRETHLEVIHRLGAAVELRDRGTGAHVERIGQLSRSLGLAAGMDAEQAEMLGYAAVMHDVGKIAIPDHILLKPAKLDPEEFAQMKTHTSIGAKLLEGSRAPLIQMAETVALTHHERWDGSGYPAGLTGEEIPLVGRICAICDTYDAMLSRRPYKAAIPPRDVMRELELQRGRQFDPHLVDVFLELIELGSVPSVASEEDSLESAPFEPAAPVEADPPAQVQDRRVAVAAGAAPLDR